MREMQKCQDMQISLWNFRGNELTKSCFKEGLIGMAWTFLPKLISSMTKEMHFRAVLDAYCITFITWLSGCVRQCTAAFFKPLGPFPGAFVLQHDSWAVMHRIVITSVFVVFRMIGKSNLSVRLLKLKLQNDLARMFWFFTTAGFLEWEICAEIER